MAKEEEDRAKTSTKAARISALSVNLAHFRRTALQEHKCEICNRPLDDQELEKFIQRQVRCLVINQTSPARATAQVHLVLPLVVCFVF